MIAAENVLATLADAPSLQSGDLEAFYNQASNAARRTGFVVVLRDAETERLVVSSNYPFGTTLYKAAQDPRTEAEKQLLRSGRSIVTGVFYGVLLKEYFVAIVMPVFKDGDVRYYLSAGIPVRRFSDILSSLHIHADQTVSVIDRNGLFVTRSHDPDAYVGTRSLRTFPAEVPSIYGAVNRNGIAFHAFNDASALLGWRISTKHA